MIKSGKPKSIKGNILGSKIAGLTLDPLTKSINKLGKADTNKVYLWIYTAGMTLLKLCQSDTIITILKNTLKNYKINLLINSLVINIPFIKDWARSKEM